MISGLSEEVLNWASSESGERYLFELSSAFCEEIEQQEMPDIPPEIDEELILLQKQSVPQSSQRHMKQYSERFISFLKEKKLSTSFEKIPKCILNNYLRYFYSFFRKSDGSFYAPATLICVRAALFRYFSSECNRNDFNITDPEFKTSNEVLKYMVFKYKRANQAIDNTKYPAIEVNDMISIRSYFDRSNPIVLQREIAFNLMYFFNLRGRETLPHLLLSNVAFETDSNGKTYIRINCDTLSKNAKASLSSKEYESIKNVRMYENEDESECPVAAFKLYTRMFADSEDEQRLFPKPLTKFNSNSQRWYCEKGVLGKNSLDNLMSTLSKELSLSKRYTNHCVRVTGITVLREQGKSDEEIASVSGHKNAANIQRYVRKRRDESHYDLSDCLQLGFSKTRNKILPVGKGKIIVKETENRKHPTDIIIEQSKSTDSKFSVCFSGNFHNCQFVMSSSTE